MNKKVCMKQRKTKKFSQINKIFKNSIARAHSAARLKITDIRNFTKYSCIVEKDPTKHVALSQKEEYEIAQLLLYKYEIL